MAAATGVHRPYHHGDLHRVLVEAATRIIEHQGVESISLREVARHAQVSHAAPYHYFANKSALLAAIATEGFHRLVEQIRQLRTEMANDKVSSTDPLLPLRCVGRGYVQFALSRPAIFRLMFRPELTQPSKNPELREAEMLAFGALQSAINEYCDAKPDLILDQRIAAAFAWSTVHGFVTLQLDAVFQETPVGQIAVDTVAQEVLRLIEAGIESVVQR